MEHLNVKDRKILLELQKNSRLTSSRIGKMVGLSWDVVNYRIKKLEERDIIKNYTITVNIYKVGKRLFKIYLRFTHISFGSYNHILEYLRKENKVKWIAETEGIFDMIIGIAAESIFEFEDIKNYFLSKFGNVIATKEITYMISYKTYGKDYLLPKLKSKQILSVMANEENESIDDIDKKIINTLGVSSKDSIVDIAKKVSLTPKIVRYRMSNLEKKGIIIKYGIAIDKEKIGYLYFKCFVGLENISKKRKKELEAYINFHPNITYMTYVIGNWELEIEYETKGIFKFYNMVHELRQRFHDVISTVDTVMIFNEEKFSLI